jgi:eukaryotic translation initiation factor 2C
VKNGKARGIMFPPQPVVIESVSSNRDHDNSVQGITEVFKNIKRKFGDSKNCFIVCVIPQKPCEQYSQAKQAAEREGNAEVLTQCILFKNFDKPERAVINNILLKINAKLGGINHVPIFPETSLMKINILKYPTLILGMDVNHPSLPTKGRPTGFPSFASVTGSGMPYLLHIQAQLRTNNNKAVGAAEIVENLDVTVKKMLMKFREMSKGCQPKRIIVFRDGVGEGQFPEVCNFVLQLYIF